MTNLLKSSVVWQFAGGFALGALGLVALHAPTDTPTRAAPTVAVTK